MKNEIKRRGLSYRPSEIRAAAEYWIARWRDEGDTGTRRELIPDAFLNLRWQLENGWDFRTNFRQSA